MKTGDLIFVRPSHTHIVSTIVGKTITGLTGQQFSHVAMAISPVLIFEAQNFTVSHITSLYHPDYEVVPMNLTDAQRKQLQDFVFSGDPLGREYDYPEIIGWLIQLVFKSMLSRFDIVKRFDNNNSFICIEAILYCYKQSLGINLVSNKDESLVLFNDLYRNAYKLSESM
jgi:hypothetical protein